MLDEEMDHIIRDAVDKHHPAYDDKAWEKMEKKLDKHLPQKEGRRRFLFFLLLFLLLGGGAFFGITYLNSNKTALSDTIAENKKTGQTQGQNDKGEQQAAQSVIQNATPAGNNVERPVTENGVTAVTGNSKNKTPGNVPNKTTANTTKMAPGVALPGKIKNDVENTGKNKTTEVVNKGKSKMRITAADPSEELVNNEKQKIKNNTPKNKNTDEKKNVVITTAEPEINENANPSATIPEQKKDVVAIAIDEQKKESQKINSDKKEEAKPKEEVVAESKPKSSPDKKKSKNTVAGNFGITLSAGPDLSFIELNKLGKATLIYGAGLSYQFKKRITVRAGFYASKKIYSATPDQYTQSGATYPYLEDINAVCKVYEIPVSLSYNFWERKNHNWFGNVGLSSFLMKSEDYDYNYKVPYSGQGYTYYTYKSAIKDKNKHYFAVLTLSAGYQYNFSKRVSLQAEPFVKLPLAGVGEGKIKLKSAGVLFTATIKPFAKKK